MMGPFSNTLAVFFAALLLLLPGCVPGKRAVADNALSLSEEYLRKGDYEKALETCNSAFRKHPNDRALRKGYLKAAEETEDAACAAFEREDYAASGRIYYLLTRQYPRFQDLTADLSYGRKYLHARLTECSDRVFERALAQYRQGNLPAAISLWKNILEFEPGNAAAKKAIETTSTQLKSLRQ
jgi:tetratricopeptide (TPR) repeat protein